MTEPDSLPKPEKNKLPTPLRLDRLKTFLKDYPPHLYQFLINGFTMGFSIPSSLNSINSSSYTNHKSALDNVPLVTSKIKKELCLGRFAGPFKDPPFADFVCSPLGLVPKKGNGQFRLIHDLSFPKDNSVNASIPEEFKSVSYQNLDHCLDIIMSLGKNTLIAKADLKDAFRIIPISPSSYHLLGFKWEGSYYFDRCLPMGCGSSCSIFESFSTAIQWILQNKLMVKHMSHILDDFIFFGPQNSNECHKGLSAFKILTESLGAPIKEEKTVMPSSTVMLHGIQVNTASLSMHLPADKLCDLRSKLQLTSRRKKVQLKELQSLIGSLQFACKAIFPGRAFLRRLYDLTCGVKNPNSHIRISAEARNDLSLWLRFLDDFNGTVIIPQSVWQSSHIIRLFTDASGGYFAATLGHQWFQGSFPDQFLSRSIAWKELLPIVLGLQIWHEQLANKKILFMTDNQSIVYIINKQSSKDKDIMQLVRSLVLCSLKYNIVFKAKHIPGKSNTIADLLSRCQVDQARRRFPALAPLPVCVPKELLPWAE